jgi:hypothetical protein
MTKSLKSGILKMVSGNLEDVISEILVRKKDVRTSRGLSRYYQNEGLRGVLTPYIA